MHILNRAPMRALCGVIPYEAWHWRNPDVSYLRTFGYTTFVKKVGPGDTKLSDRAAPMVFVGYEDGSKVYRVYDTATHKLHVTRDFVFDDGRPWSCETAPADAIAAATHAAPSTFTVEYTVTAPTDDKPASEAGSDTVTPREPCMPFLSTLDAPNEPVFVTPPTGESHDSKGVPLRYRVYKELIDNIDPYELEYSGLCLVAAKEPASVDLAMKEAC